MQRRQFNQAFLFNRRRHRNGPARQRTHHRAHGNFPSLGQRHHLPCRQRAVEAVGQRIRHRVAAWSDTGHQREPFDIPAGEPGGYELPKPTNMHRRAHLHHPSLTGKVGDEHRAVVAHDSRVGDKPCGQHPRRDSLRAIQRRGGGLRPSRRVAVNPEYLHCCNPGIISTTYGYTSPQDERI